MHLPSNEPAPGRLIRCMSRRPCGLIAALLTVSVVACAGLLLLGNLNISLSDDLFSDQKQIDVRHYELARALYNTDGHKM
eukprot:2663709-Pleurochrysis_carterae.AAC.3